MVPFASVIQGPEVVVSAVARALTSEILTHEIGFPAVSTAFTESPVPGHFLTQVFPSPFVYPAAHLQVHFPPLAL